jgi:hypothetical protein
MSVGLILIENGAPWRELRPDLMSRRHGRAAPLFATLPPRRPHLSRPRLDPRPRLDR